LHAIGGGQRVGRFHKVCGQQHQRGHAGVPGAAQVHPDAVPCGKLPDHEQAEHPRALEIHW
jgi:hypothetical protein